MIAEKRRQEILRLIEKEGSIRISKLGKLFNVTDMTIRRDIDYLSRQGLVRRVHGGAISETEGNINLVTTFLKRNMEYIQEKETIGKKAQEFIPDNSTIIIDGGSTNECLARYLDPKKNLRIITHALNIAWIVSNNENHELLMAGGILNRLTMTFNGLEVENFYNEVNADILFVSASGISIEEGLTDPEWLDTSFKKSMIKSSRKVITLADHHKFDLVTSRTFAPLTAVDIIITDAKLPPEVRRRYIEAGVNVVLA